MWTLPGVGLFGSFLVMGLSFVSPWSKSSDPSCNIVPPWVICPNNSTFVTSSQNEWLVEQRIREMIIDLKPATQMVHVSSYIDNHIQKAVAFLNASLNTSTETRLHEVLRKQNEIINKTEEYKKNTKAMIVQEDRRCRARLRNVHKSLVRMLYTLGNKSEESFRLTEMKLMILAMDLTFMKAGTWGTVMSVMGVMEIFLFVIVCFYLSRPTCIILIPPPSPQILVPIPYV